MTYGVLTILFGLVIFVVTKLIPQTFKNSSQKKNVDQDFKNKPEQHQIEKQSPEKLAQWVLKSEKAKTELKEKLCQAPVFSNSSILFGRDDVLIELFSAIN